MATKVFCDGCGQELNDSNRCTGGQTGDRVSSEVQKSGKRLGVEVLVSTDGVANTGDWCKYCVIDAVMWCDDRPKAENVR